MVGHPIRKCDTDEFRIVDMIDMESPTINSGPPVSGRNSTPRRWWIAALWALVSPPTAYVYIGRPRWASIGFGMIFVWIVFCLAAGFDARVAGLAVVGLFGLIYSALPVIFALADHKRRITHGPNHVQWYAVSLFAWLLLSAFIWLTSDRTIGLGIYKIPSGSMENTLVPGDYVLADLRAYDRNPPDRGDIVVHADPRRDNLTLIRRIAGLPGDTIQLKYKLLYVNGALINPPRTATYLDPKRIFPAEMSPRDNYGPAVVPPGNYFALGDNRDTAYDSRFWGFVPRRMVKGKIKLVCFSFWGLSLRPERLGLRVEPQKH